MPFQRLLDFSWGYAPPVWRCGKSPDGVEHSVFYITSRSRGVAPKIKGRPSRTPLCPIRPQQIGRKSRVSTPASAKLDKVEPEGHNRFRTSGGIAAEKSSPRLTLRTDLTSVPPLPALTPGTIIRRSGALGDAADRRAADRTWPAFALVDARHLIIPAVAGIQVPRLYVEPAVVGDRFAEHPQDLLAQQNDPGLGEPLCRRLRIDLRAVQRLGRVDVAQAHDLRLVEQRELNLLRAAFERVVQILGRKFGAEGLGRELAQILDAVESSRASDHHQPEMTLVVEQEFLAVVQPQHRMRVRGVFGLMVEINKPPGHTQMSDQRAPVRKTGEDVFAAPRDVLHARAFQ